MGRPENLLFGGAGVDIGTVDVVGEQGGDCDLLGAAGRGNGEEKEDKHGNGAGGAHKGGQRLSHQLH